MMPIILPYDTLRTELPEARIVIRASRDQVRRVGRESAVPHPALMAMQGRLEREGVGMEGRGGLVVGGRVRNGKIGGPDPSGVVG